MKRKNIDVDQVKLDRINRAHTEAREAWDTLMQGVDPMDPDAIGKKLFGELFKPTTKLGNALSEIYKED